METGKGKRRKASPENKSLPLNKFLYYRITDQYLAFIALIIDAQDFCDLQNSTMPSFLRKHLLTTFTSQLMTFRKQFGFLLEPTNPNFEKLCKNLITTSHSCLLSNNNIIKECSQILKSMLNHLKGQRYSYFTTLVSLN